MNNGAPREGRRAGRSWLRLLNVAFKGLVYAWLIVGLTVGLLFGLELALRFMFWVKDTARPLPHPDRRIVADGYDGAPWVDRHFREDERAEAEWQSYVYFRHKPLNGETITVDAQGRRATWNPERTAAGDSSTKPVKIWVLGGSSAWGMGARDAFTIPSLLSKILNARGHDVKVTNLAEVGYVSTQELIALEIALREGEVPDIVIFLDGVNDVLAAVQNGVAGWPQNEENRRREFASHRSAGRLIIAALRSFLQDSAILRLVNGARARLPGGRAPREPTGPWMSDHAARMRLAEAIVQAYMENLRLCRAVGRDYGFQTRHYWQPTVFAKGSRHAIEEEKTAEYAFLEPWFSEVGRLIGAQEQIVDLTHIFAEERGLVFWDFCHTTERGNRRLAEAIANDLEGWYFRRTGP